MGERGGEGEEGEGRRGKGRVENGECEVVRHIQTSHSKKKGHLSQERCSQKLWGLKL